MAEAVGVESERKSPGVGVCCVCTCDSPATGIGPHSRQPKCPEHLVEDTEHVRRLQRELHDQLQPFTAASVESLQQQVDGATADIRAVQQAFASARESMTEWESRVVVQLSEKLEASKRCLLDRQDIVEYSREEAETESSGDMQKLCQLVLSMLITVDSLKMDFDQEERARLAEGDAPVSSVLQLNGLIGELSNETAADAQEKQNRLLRQQQQAEQKQRLEMQEQQLNARLQELKTKEQQQKERGCELKEKEHQLKQQQSRLKQQERQQNEKERRLKLHEQQLKQHEQQQKEKERQLKQREDRLKQHQHQKEKESQRSVVLQQTTDPTQRSYFIGQS